LDHPIAYGARNFVERLSSGGGPNIAKGFDRRERQARKRGVADAEQ
jgi:hypothetical protein